MYVKIVPGVSFNVYIAAEVFNLVNSFVYFGRGVKEACAQIFHGCDGGAPIPI